MNVTNLTAAAVTNQVRRMMTKHRHANKILQWAKMIDAGHPMEGLVRYRSRGGRIWSDVVRMPCWEEITEYQVALAQVEGKYVFEGDVLYWNDTKVIVDDESGCRDFNGYSWLPPKPKTFVLNGAELPMPTGCSYSMTITEHYGKGISQGCSNRYFQWETSNERDMVEQAISNLLEGKS